MKRPENDVLTIKAPLWIRAAAGAAASILAALFAFVLITALDALREGRDFHLLGVTWNAARGLFGVAPMIFNTALLALCGASLGWLLSVGLALSLRFGQPKALRSGLLVLLRGMTAVPTVVYGFTGLFLLVPLIRGHLGGSGLCFLSAALLLALQGIPAMTLVIDGAASLVETKHAVAAAALGLSPLEIASRVTLPACRGALRDAAVLGLGRAMGDALIPVMVGGNALSFVTSPLGSMRTLAAHISLTLSSDLTGGEHLSLLLSGGVLLSMGFLVAGIGRALRAREARKRS
ncbi:ABC-type phosphate transport system, permease component [Jonquetella anthropi DSM 22815]|uniref:ABC-type phosphate transport system, permease component n=1 Tax=Jonquetella anthropi DSM 22815 TaxID=885272 RepID=H0UK36_9BACT|nr:ABC transporter permease subunit [Jonquetella anthropi]EEX48608.1 ABC transporter, permease protein [Jonquetella anthropi E3_33 E1]EHM13046.1 ABC-type phosphate transport system, permease component [Jonquetella anthropi DSM 22815]